MPRAPREHPPSIRQRHEQPPTSTLHEHRVITPRAPSTSTPRAHSEHPVSTLHEHPASTLRASREHPTSIPRAPREHPTSTPRASPEHPASTPRAPREHPTSTPRAPHEHPKSSLHSTLTHTRGQPRAARTGGHGAGGFRWTVGHGRHRLVTRRALGRFAVRVVVAVVCLLPLALLRPPAQCLATSTSPDRRVAPANESQYMPETINGPRVGVRTGYTRSRGARRALASRRLFFGAGSRAPTRPAG